MKRTRLVTLVFMTVMLSFLIGCGDDDDGDDNPAGPTGTDQFEVVRTALDAYVAGADGAVVKAQDLYDNEVDGDDTNDYYILSVRSEAHYDIGHVAGAANIPWKETADATQIAALPTDQPIAVYCYTGHTAGVATTVLRALGYETYNMKWGIMSWTRVDSIRVASPFDEADVLGAATETTVNTPETYELPDLDVSASSDETTIILAAANEYFDSGDGATVSAQTLFDNINDGDDTNDYYVVSVRSADDYALGHIPGAINIPWREITDVDNLKKIPADKPIAVYCYTGHTAGVATTALRMLGYEAYNMKFGICSWTSDVTVRGTTAFDDAVDAHDFPTEP